MLTQTLLVIATIYFFLRIKSRLFSALLPLSYGVTHLLASARYTNLEGISYLGFLIDELKFLGIKINQLQIALVNTDFSPQIAQSMLKLNINLVWKKPLHGFIFYPLTHILLAIGIWLVIKDINQRLRFIILVVLSVLLFFHLREIFLADPRVVSK